MNPNELRAYIHAKIPLAAYMRVAVVSLTPEQVELSAPLEPNLNVHGTLFGGSAAALGLLAAWALAFLAVEREELAAGLVVRTHRMKYLKPVTGTVSAMAGFGTPNAWRSFADSVRGTGRGRIELTVALRSEGVTCAELNAEFAVSRGA